jgi:hypothetical protein
VVAAYFSTQRDIRKVVAVIVLRRSSKMNTDARTVRDSNGQRHPPCLLINVCSKMPGYGDWKRTASLVILGVGGLASFLVGLSWGAALDAFATYVDRVENTYDLINPNHISLAHSIVSGIVGLGHFLLVFGVVALLVGLLGAAYTAVQSMSPLGHPTNGLRRAVLVVSGMMVLSTTAIAMWTTGTVSYKDQLAADPPRPASASTLLGGHQEHSDCTTPPTPEQQQAADKLAADTKASIVRYEDLSVAKSAGYQPISSSWQPIAHYLDPAYQRDAMILDPSRPEALVYANTSKGAVLLGAMYVMSNPGAAGPQIGGCLTQWHAHSLLGWKTPEMMHVWIVDVPGGPFSEEIHPRSLIGDR